MKINIPSFFTIALKYIKPVLKKKVSVYVTNVTKVHR